MDRERLHRKLLSRSPVLVSKWKRIVFYRETKAGDKGAGFSAKLWSIENTGNERKLPTKMTLQTHLGPHYYQSEVEFM